ncbi:TPA: hypothetical protein ACIJTN_004847 [Klebsiella pneumoniae]|uniref:hypothetical protein n=1 Tax=Klebsiella TaxID=570 RepID=UPI001C031AC7|nr:MULTISPECIES: hypothetical protein [Klebsiella]HCD1363646.1 hypothetical protein [Klebsiella variicola subsp. variicola]HDU4281752.1 hypothetical protein [Klebsiella variicola]EKZ6650970.1 hypothetical protein [Klebsiella pneumoniae]MBT9335093.1 hypothetical protein [Klebsiella sp. O852]HBR2513259.1 hypothetical protein [Klebsiella pneumoniae]
MIFEAAAAVTIVEGLRNYLSRGNRRQIAEAAKQLNEAITLTRLYLRDKNEGKFEGIDQDRADALSIAWTNAASLLGPIDPCLAEICMRKVLLWNYPDNQPREVIVQEGLTLVRLQEELKTLANMK